MRKLIIVLLLAAAFIAALLLFHKPAILYFAENQLSEIFKGSIVSIKDCRVSPAESLVFTDIRIQKESVYRLEVKSVKVSYSFASLLRRNIESVLIEGMDVTYSGLMVKDISARMEDDTGTVEAKSAQYDKIKAANIRSEFFREGKKLIFQSAVAKLLGGKIEGDGFVSLEESPRYAASLRAAGIDLATVVKEFSLTEKVAMSGDILGALDIEGQGAEFKIIAGNFQTAQKGGTLTIKDKRYLEAIAQRAATSMDVLVEGFQDYNYSTGKANLSLENKNLVIDVSLEGKAGKRKLDIVIHDFSLTKEGI